MKTWELDFKHFMKEHYPSRFIGALAIGLISGEGEIALVNDMPSIRIALTQELLNYQRRGIGVAQQIADANSAEPLAYRRNSLMAMRTSLAPQEWAITQRAQYATKMGKFVDTPGFLLRMEVVFRQALALTHLSQLRLMRRELLNTLYHYLFTVYCSDFS